MVSIIVRIYNMERRLHFCLDSLKKQQYQDLEIIMIDDGSTDGSAEICRSFCKEDFRFRYVFKENGGSASACNRGIREACGKWIAFCDSDDWMGETYIRDLVQAVEEENADIAIGGYQIVDENHRVYDIKRTGFAGTVNIEEMNCRFWDLLFGGLINSMWNKLFRKEVIKTLIDESITCGEDLVFNMKNFSNAHRFAFTESIEYYYFVPMVRSMKYPKNDARQCVIYSSSIKQFFSDSDLELDIDRYNKFLCGSICRDVGLIAKYRPYREAGMMISQFLENSEAREIIDGEVWRELGKNYRIVGRLLKYRMIFFLITLAKLKSG